MLTRLNEVTEVDACTEFWRNDEAYLLAIAEAKTHSLKVSLRDWMVASENIYAEVGQNVDEESFILFVDVNP